MPEYRFDSKKHYHSLDGRPLSGISTITGIVDKSGGLTWWAAEISAIECLENGWHIPGIKGEYAAAVKSPNKSAAIKEMQKRHPEFKQARYAHKEKKEEAAGEGVDYHALVEDYIKAKINKITVTPSPLISAFVEWADLHVERFILSECHCYSQKLWTGGICDFGFIGKSEGIAGDYCLGDVKRKGPYYSHFIQVGGYDLALSENGGFTENGNRILESPGLAKHYIVFPALGKPLMLHDTDIWRNRFLAALALYKGQQIYEEITA